MKRTAILAALAAACAALAPAASAQMFGHTTAYAGEQSNVANTQTATRVALDVPGTLESITAYVSGPPARRVRFALYADNNGAPGALIAETAHANLQGNNLQWQTIATPAAALEPGDYWLALCFNHNSVAYAYDAAGGATHTRSHNAVNNGFTSAWGASASSDTRRVSIYATVQGASGTPTSFGYTSEFASSENDSNGAQLATQAVLVTQDDEPAAINAITAFVKGPPGQSIRYALYADDEGEPGALITQSDAAQVGSMSFHWQTLPVPQKTLQPGVYWLAISSSHFLVEYAYTGAGGQSRRSANNALSHAFTEPWGASNASHTRRLSIYANLVPPSSRPTIVRWNEVNPD